MRRRTTIPNSVTRLAASQAGMLSVSQLSGLEPRRRRAVINGLGGVAPGLYGTGAPKWLGVVWAGLLRGGEEAVVGGLAAAHLHGLIPDPPPEVTIWIPADVARRGFAVADHHVTYRRARREGTGSPARTRVEQTVVDVALRGDAVAAVAVAARALAERRTTRKRLLAAMNSVRRLPHRQVLQELCSVNGQGVESILEWLHAELVERPHGLPRLVRQYDLGGDSRLDGLYPEFSLAVEVDGERFHDVHQDRQRDNRNIARHGVATLRYGWLHVTRESCATAAQVGEALRVRGWTGTLTRCRNCPR